MMRVAAAVLLAPLALASMPLTVRETAGVPRAGEVVRSGVPLPREANVRSTDALAIVDGAGRPIPAEFEILARWNAGRGDVTAPAQWLLVTFAASAGARERAAYRLITDGSVANPAAASPLRVTQSGTRFTIDDGRATFVVEPSSLFEEIRLDGAVVSRGGSLTADAGGAERTLGSTRRSFVEHAGPLSAVIVVEGTYGHELSSQRRYTFTAGSGTAIVRQTLAWESTRCGAGVLACDGAPNGVRVRRVRDTLRGVVPGPVAIRGARNAPPLQSAGGPAALIQTLRPARTAPPRFEIVLPAGTTGGAQADGAWLAAGPLAVALDHMHRFEPQALRLLEDGTLAIDLAGDSFWLGARQAMVATFAVGVGANADALWASLNHPLRAWPSARAFANVLDIPAGPLAEEFEDYDRATAQVLDSTLRHTDSLGVYGLMTWGLYPRAWGNPVLSDEVDCNGEDPTPQESWDDLYWCATWTDYHNASSVAVMRAMRTGEVEWLDEISRPAALRQLYTQIFQCAPDDGYFYCGQAPAGYGGYRADFNSSHAYFENLFLHYWLTGDGAVLETIERGARSMRNYLCSRRPAAPCAPGDPPVDQWANLTGRVASQWLAAFRFAGLAGDDPSYLDDYRNNLGRALAQQYLALDSYGFLLGGWQPVTSPGTHTTDQLWMTALYDTKNLEQLQRDTGDPSIDEVLLRLARTLDAFGPPSVFEDWPNSLDVTWTGARTGGTILSVRATPGGGDPLLYDTGKATLSGPVARAAARSGDPSLSLLARDLTRQAIANSLADPSPLGKIEAELLARLHAAVAHLTPPSAKRRAVRR